MGIKNVVRQHGRIRLLIIVLIAIGVASQAQEPAFLKHATRVKIPRVFFGGPQWLSPYQFVDCVWPGDKSVKAGIYSYDVTTQKLTRLDALTNLARNAVAYDDPAALQSKLASSDRRILDISSLSPNGEWLLWRELWPANLHLARLDGSRSADCAPPDAGVYWMQDSRYWAVFKTDKTGKLVAQIYDVNAPNKSTVVPIATSTDTFSLAVNPLGDPPQLSTYSLVLDDHMFWSTFTFNGSQTVEVVELGINRPASTLHTYTIQLPSHSVVQEMEISPDGKKIAWVLTSRAWPRIGRSGFPQAGSHVGSLVGETEAIEEAKALQKEMRDAAEKFYHEGPQTKSLWASNLDGSNMQRLGEVTFEWHSGPLPDLPFASRLRWIPGGRLSFDYDGSLYTLPIE